MKTLDCKVGYLCNNHCLHCAISDMRRELKNRNKQTDLTTQEIFKILDENKKQYDNIVLTGGEITLRKDFLQILEKANQYELIQVQTNGRKINTDLARSIAIYRNKISFAVAIHGSNDKVHDAITQVKHSFNETVNGIKALRQNNLKVCMKVVVSALNYKQLPEIVQLANQLNVNRINFAYVHGCGDARINIKQLLVQYDKIRQYINTALDIAETYHILADLETFPFCTFDSKHWHKSCDLNLLTENTVCIPTNADQFEWDRQGRSKDKCKYDCCKKCMLRNICEGTWSEYPWSLDKPAIESDNIVLTPENAIVKINLLNLVTNK